MTSYLKSIVYCWVIFLSFSLIGCKDSELEVPELPPTIVVGGENPLKTGIYMDFVDGPITINDYYYGIDSVWIDYYSISDTSLHKIDTSLLGYYQATYHALSSSGMEVEAKRDIWVVVKPESMKGLWDVDLGNSSLPFTDSLSVENKKLFINNLNNIPGLKIELSLAADLQDSVYIFERNISDSLYYILGSGIIDERAQQMKLKYFINGEDVMMKCEATYSKRDTTSTK
jgi:hypothetical protein